MRFFVISRGFESRVLPDTEIASEFLDQFFRNDSAWLRSALVQFFFTPPGEGGLGLSRIEDSEGIEELMDVIVNTWDRILLKSVVGDTSDE